MNELQTAILELKKQCEMIGEDLYAIEIGEKALGKLGCPDQELVSHYLGIKIYIHRRSLREYSLEEILTEIKFRNNEKIEMLKLLTKLEDSHA